MKYTEKQLNEMLRSDLYFERICAAEQGYRLDILVMDENPLVREEVARQGYGLDKLVSDPVSTVRLTVAQQGYRPEMFVNDEEPLIRYEIAKQGLCLNKLVHDRDHEVRAEVARQGYGLDILRKDDSLTVRDAVWEYEHRDEEIKTLAQLLCRTKRLSQELAALTNEIHQRLDDYTKE